MNAKVETSAEVTARHDAISKALEGIPEFGDDFKLPGQAAQEEAADTPSGDAQTDDASTATLSRDEKGKFAKAEKSPSERPVEAPADPEAAKATTYEAPKNWSADRRTAFAQLPEPAQKLLLDVHKESSAGFTKYAQDVAPAKKLADSVSKAFEPYRGELTRNGLDEAGALAHLIQEREQFNRDPVAFLTPLLQRSGDPVPFVRALIEKTGLTQEKLFGAAKPVTQEDPGNAWADPGVLEIRQQLTPLQQKLTSLEQLIASEQQKAQTAERARQAEQEQQRQRELEATENDLSTIIGSADDAGNPKYPHFDAVEDTIARLLQTDPSLSDMPNSKLAEKFDLAYRRAVRLHDDLYQQETEAEFQRRMAAAQKQKTVQKAAVAATRKGSPGSAGGVSPGPMSSREAISKAFGDLGIV